MSHDESQYNDIVGCDELSLRCVWMVDVSEYQPMDDAYN